MCLQFNAWQTFGEPGVERIEPARVCCPGFRLGLENELFRAAKLSDKVFEGGRQVLERRFSVETFRVRQRSRCSRGTKAVTPQTPSPQSKTLARDSGAMGPVVRCLHSVGVHAECSGHAFAGLHQPDSWCCQTGFQTREPCAIWQHFCSALRMRMLQGKMSHLGVWGGKRDSDRRLALASWVQRFLTNISPAQLVSGPAGMNGARCRH